MTTILEHRPPWPVEAGSQSIPPAVVCALNGSPQGRAAAAYAAALARSLGWRLGLVASGLRPLEPDELAQAVVQEQAGIVVQPTTRRGHAGAAGELAGATGAPVIAVPTHGLPHPPDGPIVCAADEAAPEVADVALHLSLAIGAQLRLTHDDVDQRVPRLLEAASAARARLVVLAAEHAPAVPTRGLPVPVMFVPTRA